MKKFEHEIIEFYNATVAQGPPKQNQCTVLIEGRGKKESRKDRKYVLKSMEGISNGISKERH